MDKDRIYAYWQSVLKQEGEEMRKYFHTDASIRWHNSNEQFTVEEFIIANCTYPGNWQGEIQRMETCKDVYIVVAHVFSNEASFHVTSFMKCENEKIATIDEYWGDDDEAPTWRKQLEIGKKIT